MYVMCTKYGLPRWLSGQKPTCSAGDAGDMGSNPGSGRLPGGGRKGTQRVGHDWSDWAHTYTEYVCESESHSVMSDSLLPHGLYSPWNSPGKNTGVGSLSLFQGIFPTQGLNPGLPHSRWILYHLSHKGSPRIQEWVSYPFSSRYSWPRNSTRVSCTAGRFFTNWDFREAHICTSLKQSLYLFPAHYLTHWIWSKKSFWMNEDCLI